MNVQGENIHTFLKYRNILGRVGLLHNCKSVTEIGFDSGCWLLRVGKQLENVASVGGWMGNDVIFVSLDSCY